jgi:membrane fusion protein (multidrug efflux system)
VTKPDEKLRDRPVPLRFRPGALRRAATIVALAVAVVAAGAWSFTRWRFGRTHVSSDNAQVDGHVVPVLAKVGGYVGHVLVQDNRRVQAGDLVVALEDDDLRLRLSEAEADVAAALAAAGTEGVTGQIEAEAAAARARREALEERLAAANAHRERTARDLERMEDLAAKRIVSSQQLDAARAAAAAAAADLAGLERDVSAARAAETAAAAAGRAADARLERSNVAVMSASRNVEYAKVRAPTSGIVSQTQVEVGQLVQAGQPLAAVVADSSLWITANLKETETSEVRPGQPVVIDVDAYPGCEVRGVVESLSPATGSRFALIPPDNATGNFTKVVQRVPVRIAIESACGPDRPLRAGMSVVVHIETG